VSALPLVLAILAATLSWPIASPRLPAPNRGTQLFLVMEPKQPEPGGVIVAITERRTDVYQTWHPAKGTYDFITAVVTSQFAGGTTVNFTRSVMTQDYVPRVEQSEFTFPYAEQPRYRFFDFGHITGFYRNSVEDFSPREFMPHSSPNQIR
jgi:translation elongation factor P/translation initiation factor 5A